MYGYVTQSQLNHTVDLPVCLPATTVEANDSVLVASYLVAAGQTITCKILQLYVLAVASSVTHVNTATGHDYDVLLTVNDVVRAAATGATGYAAATEFTLTGTGGGTRYDVKLVNNCAYDGSSRKYITATTVGSFKLTL